MNEHRIEVRKNGDLWCSKNDFVAVGPPYFQALSFVKHCIDQKVVTKDKALEDSIRLFVNVHAGS